MAAAENRGGQVNGRAPGHGLEVRCRDDRGKHFVELEGELDLSSVDALRAELDQAAGLNGGVTVVDLHRLKFIDSTGLGVLFEAFERGRATGREIVFTRSSPAVERILRLTGLDRILPSAGEARDGDGRPS